MENHIKKISCYAGNILKSSDYGKVHSIYRRTINLTFDGKLAALQTEGSPLSPISLITALTPADMEALNITEGDSVVLSKNGLEIILSDVSAAKSYFFSYTDIDKYDLRLPGNLCTQNCIILAGKIRAALSLSKKGGFQLLFSDNTSCNTAADNALILSAAKHRMDASITFYHNKNYSKAALELSGLLGLGSGLTPSGDDFLCGVLAGLQLLGRENSNFAKLLRSEIQKHLKDTIDISAAFLSCALDGQYSLAVKQLYNMPETAEILTAFSEIGHSSGTDTLCGVLYALELGTTQ